MAKKTIEQYFSDLSDKEITEGYSPLSFAFDGIGYEIDLTEAEKAAFTKSIQKYIDVARTVTRQTATRRRSTGGPEPRAVRQWAAENGVEVPARGRIPAAVLEAYRAAR